MNTIFIMLLGCNIYSILMNRIDTSVNFIEKNFNIEEETKITWFLSGGIKDNFLGARSEASIMKSHIDNYISMKYNYNSLNIFEQVFIDSDSELIDLNNQTQHQTKSKITQSTILWDYILDEKSTNTAENFIMASSYLNLTTNTYDQLYVVTSDFHFTRANYMLSLIDTSNKFQWILGDMELDDSRYWEKIHIKNVYSDVQKAQALIS